MASSDMFVKLKIPYLGFKHKIPYLGFKQILMTEMMIDWLIYYLNVNNQKVLSI